MKLIAVLKRFKWVTVLILAAFLFYWYEIRPVRIIRSCATDAATDARTLLKSKAEITNDKKKRADYDKLIEKGMYLRSDYESFYRKCLSFYGFIEDPNEVEAQ
ncbi:MAG: hypothetical protein Q7R81_02520 [Candidatus Peregrinibacteria bacterium]|nr:hypothetical protein [Candidatus Peregrinibacteria bacterium]